MTMPAQFPALQQRGLAKFIKLALDFSANETLDSRITFSRTSNATRTNAQGLIETVAVNQPRFDYDPVTLAPKGLLIEEARTNLLTYSERYEITNSLAVTGLSGTFQNGETVTATGGGSGTYIASGSSSTVILVGPASGTFSGTLTGGTSGATATISSSTAVWAKSNATVTTNAIVAPDGTLTADQFNRLSTTAAYLTQTLTKPASALPYVAVVYAKKSVGDYFAVRLQGTYPNRCDVVFNLTTGINLTPTVVGTFTSPVANIIAVGNGWYRCTLSGITDITTAIYPVFSFNSNGVVVDGNDSTNSSSGYIWGAQLEAGTFPTSYIPTTSGQVTRTADNASMVGTNFSSWYNQSEGTLVGEFDMYNATVISGTFPRVISISNGTNANSIDLQSRQYANEDFSVTDAAVEQCAITLAQFAANTFGKLAGTYQVNNFQAAANGVLGTADLTGTVPAVNQLQLGNRWDMARPMSGHIKSFKYFSKRLLNTYLQRLTR